MVLLVVVSSEMVAYGGRNGLRKVAGCVDVVGLLCFLQTGEGGRDAGVDGKLTVVMRRKIGGSKVA